MIGLFCARRLMPTKLALATSKCPKLNHLSLTADRWAVTHGLMGCRPGRVKRFIFSQMGVI